MKISLSLKLMLSYAFLLFVLTFSLIYVTHKVFIREFNTYVINNQVQMANKAVDDTLHLLEKEGNPSHNDFYTIANHALDNGIVYKYTDENEDEIFHMSKVEKDKSEKQASEIEAKMNKIYKNFDGEYIEEAYEIYVDDEYKGYVTLGVYQPFYYGNFEVGLITAIRNSHIIVGSVVFVIAIITSVFFAKTISKPLNTIISKTDEMKQGKYKKDIYINTNTKEIVEITDSINDLNRELANQVKIKQQMAQNYAHEIRTPLTSISSTLEGVKDEIIPLTDERLDSLISEVERLNAIVSNLDKISRHNNKLEIFRTKVNIVELVKEVVILLEPDFKSKDIDLDVVSHLLEGECIINVDVEKIRSVIINLLSNACKYTDKNGSVEVLIEYKNNKHEITVIDNGIGISEIEMKHIFEHLYRVDKSRVKETEGYGVGLCIVKDIVDAHSGKIEVESVVGKGSKFKVIL